MDFSKLTGAFRASEPPVETPDDPPTVDDHEQAVTHHLDSVRYNAKHAAAHQDEMAKHAKALMGLLKRVPGFARHAKRM